MTGYPILGAIYDNNLYPYYTLSLDMWSHMCAVGIKFVHIHGQRQYLIVITHELQ